MSGADPIEARPGFTALLARIAGNSVRTIIVETANRFARDLMVQEVGFAMLQGLGITLIAADSPASFLDDGPTSKLIRQILGAVSEFDKAMIVAKLRGARERVRRTNGKCEGRKSYAEAKPELVALAKRLNRELPRSSLRDIILPEVFEAVWRQVTAALGNCYIYCGWSRLAKPRVFHGNSPPTC